MCNHSVERGHKFPSEPLRIFFKSLAPSKPHRTVCEARNRCALSRNEPRPLLVGREPAHTAAHIHLRIWRGVPHAMAKYGKRRACGVRDRAVLQFVAIQYFLG